MAHFGLDIKNLNNLISRRVQNLKTIAFLDELTGSNGVILNYLEEHSDVSISQKDIEKVFGITRSTASKVLSLMEKKGLIERHVDDFDARAKKIVITEKGCQAVAAIQMELKEFEASLTAGFKQEELEMLSSFISRMKKNIEE